jgi:DNA-binding transcriptional ArsR family regulator
MDINRLLLNPVRGRIIQHLALGQTATAGDIAELMKDVPRTTLYRHLGLLAEHSIIKVVSESRVRGSMERTYALNVQTLSELNTTENALSNFFGFLMKIYADFAQYFGRDSADPRAERIFMTNNSLLLNDEEFDELLGELGMLLRKHLQNEPGRNRRQRSLSLISSPCLEEGIVNNDENKKQKE